MDFEQPSSLPAPEDASPTDQSNSVRDSDSSLRSAGFDGPEEGLVASLSAALQARGQALQAIEPLAGDVSVRRYFRVRLANADSAILAWYPDSDRGTCERFRATTGYLETVRVPVPSILDIASDRSWCLVEDLGEHTLYDVCDPGGVDWQRLAPYFEDAIELLGRIATLPKDSVADLNPPLDAALLRQELEKTLDFFVRPRGLAEPDGLGAALDALCRNLGQDRITACHRDFMARNLVPLGTGASSLGSGEGCEPNEPDTRSGTERVAVLDHQDLRLGPAAYDLASLLNDSLFAPEHLEERWLARFDGPLENYHRAAAQRTLKAIGTYAAFAARGSNRHLPLIAPTLERAILHLSRAPETEAVAPYLAEAWSDHL